MKARRHRRRRSLVILAVVATSACTPTIGETADTTLPPMSIATLADQTRTVPPTTAAVEIGSDPQQLAPLDDQRFDFKVVLDSDISTVRSIGLVRLPTRDDDATDIECIAYLGLLTADATSDLLLSPKAIPRLALNVADGDETKDLEPDSSNGCNRGDLDTAGWGIRSGAKLRPKASYAFASVFEVPANATLNYISVADAGGSAATYFEPTLLGAVPALPPPSGGSAPIDSEDPQAGSNKLDLGDDRERFEIGVFGLVGPIERTDGGAGECFAVLGSLKPTQTIGSVVNAYALPPISVIIDGVARPATPKRCAQSSIESSGWYPYNRPGVTTGNTFAFVQTFAVQAGAGPAQAVLVGDPFNPDRRRVVSAVLLEQAPEPPAREQANPSLDLVGVAPAVIVPDENTQTGAIETEADTWRAAVYGIVALPSDAAAATCYGVLLSWRVQEANDDSPPRVGLIAGGAYWSNTKTEAVCDTASLTNAGWTNGADVTAAQASQPSTNSFVAVFVPNDAGPPAAIAVGNAADDTGVFYVDPTVLSAPPAAG